MTSSVAEKKIDSKILTFVEGVLKNSDFELIPLAGDASNRIYHRVVSNDNSWVLMVWDPFTDDTNYPFLSVLEHFAKHSVHVPTVLGKDAGLGLILLEDLGDLTLERKFWEFQDPIDSLPFYKQAIDELINIHYTATKDNLSPCTAFDISFDTEKLLWEMNYGRKHLLEGISNIQLTETEEKALDRIFLDICSKLDREPKVICHRDYHSRNLMLKLGKMRVIDFQDARMGPIQYDLVSLIHDSYVDLNDETTEQLLKYYLEVSTPLSQSPISRGHFDDLFRLQLIQRCFKACGSFSSFYNMRKDVRYLKYLTPTIRKVAKHLEYEPEYMDFLNILNDRGVLENKYETLCTP